jgi:hypothetical protein
MKVAFEENWPVASLWLRACCSSEPRRPGWRTCGTFTARC